MTDALSSAANPFVGAVVTSELECEVGLVDDPTAEADGLTLSVIEQTSARNTTAEADGVLLLTRAVLHIAGDTVWR